MPKAYKPLPPAAELWERYDYNPLTGALIWKNPPKRCPQLKGRRVGTVDKKDGYLVAEFNIQGQRSRYGIHRVVWKWVTGEDPGALQIDHINHNTADNSWTNLRLVTTAQNQLNRAGVRGYRFKKNGWEASIAQQYLGRYRTEKEAKAAYLHAKAQCL